MKVEIFNVCDFATADSGKLTVVGIFDTIYAAETPATHGVFALAGRIRFGPEEVGEKKFKISFSDADGASIMPSVEFSMTVRGAPGVPFATVQIVSIISQLKLPSFGEYSIELTIDGQQAAVAPLFVSKPQAGESQSQLPLS